MSASATLSCDLLLNHARWSPRFRARCACCRLCQEKRKRAFQAITRRSTPGARGVPEGWPKAVVRPSHCLPSHHFVNQHTGEHDVLTLDMGPASDMMNGNTLEIVSPRWPRRQVPEVVAKLNTMGDQATSRVFPGTEAVRFPESPGFRTGLMSVHTSRTMMLAELSLLLEEVPPDAPSSSYRSAIIEKNALGKSTRSTRLKTANYLVELFALDTRSSVFRLLRFFWAYEQSGKATLAFLAASARDTLLREFTPLVLQYSHGEPVKSTQIVEHIRERYPERFRATTLKSTAQNLASSWTQAGFLSGKVAKRRSQPPIRMASGRQRRRTHRLDERGATASEGGPRFHGRDQARPEEPRQRRVSL